MKRWILAVVLVALFLAWATTTAHSQASERSTCSVNMRVCFNEIASTPGPHGMIRANTNDSFPTTGRPAYRRAILIFHADYDPDTRKYVWVLKAQAPWCVAVSNCYVEWPTDDPDPTFARTLWWGATLDSTNHVMQSAVGYPSP